MQGFFRKAAQFIARGGEGLQTLLNAIFNPTFHILKYRKKRTIPGVLSDLCAARWRQEDPRHRVPGLVCERE